jgi:hypothetical protein
MIPIYLNIFAATQPAALPDPVNGPFWYTDTMGPDLEATGQAASMFRVDLPAGPGVCLDASNPVFYVRKGFGAHADDWVVFIPGGGSASDLDDVVAGWSPVFGDPPQYGEMSSRWAPPGIAPGGLFDNTGNANPFFDWNVVFIHKCSFDRFEGRDTGMILTTTEDHGVTDWSGGFPVGVLLSAGTRIEVRFAGHDIVDDVIAALGAGVVYADGAGEQVAMPSLTQARHVLFAGHSGGAQGAEMIIDDVAALIRGQSPNADVRLVSDAGFLPGAELVNQSPAPDPSIYKGSFGIDPLNGQDELAAYTDALDPLVNVWQADLDATCAANEPDPAACADDTHVVMNWVETPFFVRQDLLDSRHLQNADDCWGVDWRAFPDECYPDAAGPLVEDSTSYAQWTTQQAWDLLDTKTKSDTAKVLHTALVAPSGFFPACGNHGGIASDLGFYDTISTGAHVASQSYANALWRWVQTPATPSVAVEPIIQVYPPPGCP